jgi:DNA-binding transcriptional regulator of glucitol operon
MGLWWIGSGSVQCVVGLRVRWLSVVALCSVWWFAGMVVVGLQWTDFDSGFVVVMGCGFCRWWLWVVDFVVVVDGILYYSHLQLLFNKVVEVGQRGERKRDMKGYFKKYIYI